MLNTTTIGNVITCCVNGKYDGIRGNRFRTLSLELDSVSKTLHRVCTIGQSNPEAREGSYSERWQELDSSIRGDNQNIEP